MTFKIQHFYVNHRKSNKSNGFSNLVKKKKIIAEMLKCSTRYIFLLLRSLMTKMEMKDLELWAIIACLGDLECEEE